MRVGPQPDAVALQQGAFRHTAAPAQNGLDAQHELAHAERLDHVIVRSQAQAHHAVHFLAARREHQHRNGRGLGLAAQPAADLKAVQGGQHHIQDNQARQMPPGQLQPLLAVLGLQHAEALALQIEAQQFADVAFIFHYQDMLCAHISFPLCCGAS